MVEVHFSITAIALFALSFTIALVILLIYLSPGSKKLTTVPGPTIVDYQDGNINDIQNAGSLHQYLKQIHQKFGSIVSFWYGRQLIISNSNLKSFAPRTQVFEIPEFLFENWKSCVGKESFIFSKDISIFQRRENLEFNLNSKIKERYAQIFQTLTKELIEKWKSRPDDEHIPLTRHMQIFAIKAISKLVFGDFFDSPKKLVNLHNYWEKCWSDVVSKSNNEPTRSIQDIEKDSKNLQEIVEEAIEARWNDEKTLPVLIDRLLIASNKNLTHQQLVADSITLLTVGIQTSVSIATWMMFYLIENEEIQENLRKKLNEVHSLSIMPETLVDQKYLRNIIKESIRCGEIFSYCGRKQDLDEVLDEHLIHKQTTIIESIAVSLHNNCDDPHKFKPDRFIDDVETDPMQFIPFAFATSRYKPEKSLVYLLVAICVASLTKQFKFKSPTCDSLNNSGNYDNLTSMPSNEDIWIIIESCE